METPKAAEATTLEERARAIALEAHCRYCPGENNDPRLKCKKDIEYSTQDILKFARTLLEEADRLPYESAGAIGKSSDFAAGHLEGWKEMKRRLRRMAGKE